MVVEHFFLLSFPHCFLKIIPVNLKGSTSHFWFLTLRTAGPSARPTRKQAPCLPADSLNSCAMQTSDRKFFIAFKITLWNAKELL